MKKKLAIISVLKPVDDPRNYKKIGISLAETNKYEINIIGFSAKSIPAYPNISFQPLFNFKRLSPARLSASWKIYKFLLKVKPDIIIANTHEILTVIVLHKIIFGTKILYDIQENYFRNILGTSAFPQVVKHVLALYVRAKEMALAPFFDFFFLAEKCYEKELGFTGKRYAVIENKYIPETNPTPAPNTPAKPFTLVYTGTIAEEYGIFDAVEYAVKLRNVLPDLQLRITGHCPNRKTYIKLKKLATDLDFIVLKGSEKPVPHEEIIRDLEASDVAILPYRLDTYYSSRIPTKIYECIGLKRPMLIRKNPAWQPLYDEFDAFIFTDFHTVNEDLARRIRQKDFYTRGNIAKALWNSEKGKVVTSIEHLFNKR